MIKWRGNLLRNVHKLGLSFLEKMCYNRKTNAMRIASFGFETLWHVCQPFTEVTIYG